MDDTRWDHGLKVTGEGEGLAGHAGAVLLAHHEPVFGAPPSDTMVRRTLELADPRTLDKIARVRAAVRGRVWSLVCARPAGFPWLVSLPGGSSATPAPAY
jgi:hypothetical protein